MFAKTEFKANFAATFGVLLMWVVCATAVKDQGEQRLYIGIAAQLFGIVMMVSMLVFPVVASVRVARVIRQQAQTIDNIASVGQLLAMPAGAAAFVSFCSSEFNSARPLFWLRVRDFRNGVLHNDEKQGNNTTRHYLDEAVRIHAMYVRVGAPFEMKIRRKLRKRVQERIDALIEECKRDIQARRDTVRTVTGGSHDLLGTPRQQPAVPAAAAVGNGTLGLPTIQLPGTVALDIAQEAQSRPATHRSAVPDSQRQLDSIKSIFDEAQQGTHILSIISNCSYAAVEALMEKDCFHRFKITPYRQFVDEAAAWAVSMPPAAVEAKLSWLTVTGALHGQAAKPRPPNASDLAPSEPAPESQITITSDLLSHSKAVRSEHAVLNL